MPRDPRRTSPRDRREIMKAIGRGRVKRIDGIDWRFTANNAVPGHSYSRGKVRVSQADLDAFVHAGLAELDGDTWRLTEAGLAQTAGLA